MLARSPTYVRRKEELLCRILCRAFLGFFVGCAFPVDASSPWLQDVAIPPGGRANPLQLQPHDFERYRQQGRLHAYWYPVEVSGALPPWQPLVNVLRDQQRREGWYRLSHLWLDPFRWILREGIHIDHEYDVLAWMGLHPFPSSQDQGLYQVPYPGYQNPDLKRPDFPLGVSFYDTPYGKAFSFGCASCHAGQLFGKTVLGLSNRFPRAYDIYTYTQPLIRYLGPRTFQKLTQASSGERLLYERLREHVSFVGVRRPQVLGLDTSLAIVGLSLALRAPNEHADRVKQDRSRFQQSWLKHHPSDSKPSVWWNLKYKNRWLADGSIRSGNPILTNIFWNEIGRGSDLQEISHWVEQNSTVIDELTTAVFASEAPRYTDFFSPDSISLRSAKRGQAIFREHCMRCHGTYVKAWEQVASGSDADSDADRIRTIQVIYPQQTPVMDVGTDPYRFQAMKSLEALNALNFSKTFSIRVEASEGYVPPPLEGIWARWPYFHNNSIPNLCALLTRSELRPKVFFMGEAVDRNRDFDSNCVGYPLGSDAPTAWQQPQYRYDTRKPGLSNQGHDEGIFLEEGRELLSASQKQDLIEFLKTL